MKHNIKTNEENLSGVYKIVNLITNDFYIGSTNKFWERFKSHKSELQRAKSSSRILQNAVIKYGLDNFEFTILEICSNYRERECVLIRELSPYYNIVLESQEKRIISDDTRKRMSQSQKGRIPWNKGKTGLKYKKYITGFKRNKPSRAIKSTNLLTGEIIIHESVKAVLKHFDFKSKASIYNCCLGHQNSVFNIKFEYYSP